MSLSQKHAGLILVPWFNSEEWHYVYSLVYSKDRDQQNKALDILNIWKLRTPILSTGVEGTLILLEALMLNRDSLTEDQLSNLYAIALMRFLNLSAANSEKQGSFAKTSAKNELPKWLINLRHDIAHGHQIPSLYNLKMGLDFGFNWLRDKYWEPQSKVIKDYCVGDDLTTDNLLLKYMNAYVEINMALFEDRELDYTYLKNIKELIYKKFKRNVTHPYLLQDTLLELIILSLKKDYLKKQLSFDKLVSPSGLLTPHFKVLVDEDGNENLDTKFRNLWQGLLNAFHKFGLLFVLIEKLFDVIDDIAYLNSHKKMGALWIKEIIIALQNLKDLAQSEEDNLKLESSKYIYCEDAVNFQTRVLHASNKYSGCFLESLLKFISNSETYTQDVLNIVKAKSGTDYMCAGSHSKIYTLEDLAVENLSLEDIQVRKNVSNCSDSALHIVAESKWKKIEDTSIFKNCPLGVLPHQLGQKHPFLVLC